MNQFDAAKLSEFGMAIQPRSLSDRIFDSNRNLYFLFNLNRPIRFDPDQSIGVTNNWVILSSKDLAELVKEVK